MVSRHDISICTLILKYFALLIRIHNSKKMKKKIVWVSENGERAGRATCKGDFQSGAYWGNVQIKRRCGTPDNLVEVPDEESDERMDNEEDGEEFENLVQRMTPEERLKELAEVNPDKKIKYFFFLIFLLLLLFCAFKYYMKVKIILIHFRWKLRRTIWKV